MRDSIARLTPEQRAELESRLRARRSPTTPSQIEPRSDQTTWPLSAAQMRIWSLSRLRPGDATYNMQRAWRLVGPLHVGALEASLREVVRRHETLRARFVDRAGTAEQTIRPLDTFTLSVESGPAATDSDRLDHARAVAKTEAERPFDLSNDLLIRATLLELDRDDYVLAVTTHHLVCDGWSMDVIERELAAAYNDIVQEVPSSLMPLPIQYADFAVWQDQRRDGPEWQKEIEYWNQRLRAPVAPLLLPGRRQLTANAEPVGAHLEVSMDPQLTDAIKRLSRDSRVTPFMTLLAGFQLTLHQATGQQEIVLCSPAAGRIHLQTEQLVGYFNNLVVLRGDLSNDPTVRQLLEQNRILVPEAFDNQGAAFQDVASLPDVAAVPLARGLFTLQETSPNPLQLPGVIVTPFAVEAETADFELAVFLREVDGQYRSVVRFHRNVLGTHDVESLMARFEAVLRLMIESPDSPRSIVIPPDPQAAGEGAATRLADQPAAGDSRPVSLLESQLIEIWQRLFNKKPISRHDDFFELGGHSLLAAELFAEIEKRIVNEPMPLATLFQAPTITELARVISAGGWSESWASLVPIQPKGSRPPLFFVHAHGGNVIGYRDLARRLGGDQPFYGLQAPEMNSSYTSPSPRRLEEMATRYIDELRDVQPHGPYVLGGWCLGGDVAFEMAQQLVAADEDVALLVMVDNPRVEFVAPEMSASRPRRLWNQIRTRLHMEWFNFAEVSMRLKPRIVLGRFGRIAKLGVLSIETLVGRWFTIPHSRAFKMREVERAYTKAYEAYHPKPYSGRVALVRARQQPFGRAPASALGWERYVDRPIEIIEAPGHRVGMLSEPRVATVAELIRGVMERALADFDRSGQ